MNRLFAGLALAFALSGAQAADPFTDASQKAYAPYRAALFKTNATSQPEAQQALEQAQRAWSGIVGQFAGKVPPPYDRDPGFAATLNEVAGLYDRADAEIRKGRLPEAHEILEEVRDRLAELRRRNQVIVYSDHMNAYHSEMEHVVSGADGLLAQPDGLQKLTAQAGVLAYLSVKLASEAPPEYLKNEEFDALLKAQRQSVDDLQSALLARDSRAVKDAVGKLKKAYSRLFLKFG